MNNLFSDVLDPMPWMLQARSKISRPGDLAQNIVVWMPQDQQAALTEHVKKYKEHYGYAIEKRDT